MPSTKVPKMFLPHLDALPASRVKLKQINFNSPYTKKRKPQATLAKAIHKAISTSSLLAVYHKFLQKKITILDYSKITPSPLPQRYDPRKPPEHNRRVLLKILTILNDNLSPAGNILLNTTEKPVLPDQSASYDLVYYSDNPKDVKSYANLSKYSKRLGPSDTYPGSIGVLRFTVDPENNVTLVMVQSCLAPGRIKDMGSELEKNQFKQLPVFDRGWSKQLLQTFLAICQEIGSQKISFDKSPYLHHDSILKQRVLAMAKTCNFQVVGDGKDNGLTSQLTMVRKA